MHVNLRVVTEEARGLGVAWHVCEVQLVLYAVAVMKARRAGRGDGGGGGGQGRDEGRGEAGDHGACRTKQNRVE